MDDLIRIRLLENIEGMSNDVFSIVTAYADKRPIKAATINRGVDEMKDSIDKAREFASELGVSSYEFLDKVYNISDETEA